jgi:hypothetical protein
MEKFYTHLLGDAGGDNTKAACAQPYAMAHLRSVEGENNFARYRYNGGSNSSVQTEPNNMLTCSLWSHFDDIQGKHDIHIKN